MAVTDPATTRPPRTPRGAAAPHRITEPLTIGEVAARLGLDADTLRWFERRGVVPPPGRDGAGRRVYTEKAVHLLEVLLHLRRTGMPLAEIAEFTRHVSRDPEGVQERLDLLVRHRGRVEAQQEQLARSMAVVEQKIRDYRERLDRTDPDRGATHTRPGAG